MKLIFYTDYKTNISKYCLLNIKYYGKHTGKLDYLIDPGVHELKKNTEYSKIDLAHEIAGRNEQISIDYPNDMNLKYSDLFIQKSIDNNIKYSKMSNYIATVQFKFKDYRDFVYRLNELSSITDLSNKILGIGNMCRIFQRNMFTTLVFNYLKLFIKKHNIKRIHFYGLAIKLIEEACYYFKDLDITVSVDSTKWTKRIHTRPPLDKSICCRKHNRDVYFVEYMKEIKRRTGIEVIY